MKNKPFDSENSGFYTVNLFKSGEHTHKIFNNQLRGDSRDKVVQDVILNSNGSAEDWVNKQITEKHLAGEEVPDVKDAKKVKNVVRNALHEYMNKEMVSTCWIANLQYVSQTSRILLNANKIQGYVQKLDIEPEFCLALHCEKQLETIEYVEPQKRMLFVDSSGGLVKMTKQMNEYYQRIQNYVFLLKDVSKLHEYGAVINEVVSSQHDTGRLSEMFQTMKNNFEKLGKESLFFRYVVSDLCWPTIHAILAVLNLETIHDYSKRINKYSTDEDVNPLEQKGFLASCISHSTHRFTRGLKRYVKFADKEHKVFVGCCFSLLAQTTELTETKLIFRFMCEVFLRPVDDDVSTKAREALQQLIILRPNDKTEILKVIKEVYPDALSESEDECDSSNDNENPDNTGAAKRSAKESEDEWFSHDNKSTIKDSSPFTNVFLALEEEVENAIDFNDSGDVNSLFNPDLIHYLQKFYMPYVFIWSGYVFRMLDDDYNITKIDQGCIEKYFGTTKRIRGHQPIVPARHVLQSLQNVLANNVMMTKPKKTKELNIDDTEQAPNEATSKWSSKNIYKQNANKKNLVLTTKKKINMGFSKPQKTLQQFVENKESKKRKIEPDQPQILKIKSQVPVTNAPVTHAPISLPNNFSDESADSDEEDLKIEEDTTTAVPAKKFFCYYCQKQFKNSQEIYQHNTTQKHKKTSLIRKRSSTSAQK